MLELRSAVKTPFSESGLFALKVAKIQRSENRIRRISSKIPMP